MKEQIKEIIESYCEGITFLEFRADDLDEMVDKILTLQLQQTGVSGCKTIRHCRECNEEVSCDKDFCNQKCETAYFR